MQSDMRQGVGARGGVGVGGDRTDDVDPMQQLEEAKARVEAQLEVYDRRLRDFVEQHPVATVFGALAVGYVVGRLFSGR